MKKLLAMLLACLTLFTAAAFAEETNAWEEKFLEKANAVVVTDDAVTFTDANGNEVTIAKNPEKVAVLYASFTTLWYEAGGKADVIIGGSSSSELYEMFIGRDICQDEGMTIAATTSSGKKWDVETIIATQPSVIICSTAMSGYATISGPAEAAGIPVIAMKYDDFSDYLKWFKVFSALNQREDLWDTVALPTLDAVVAVLNECPTENVPNTFCVFAGSESLQANTQNTVVGEMIVNMNAKNIVDAWPNDTGAERLDINLETVFAADPDMIIVQCHGGEEAGTELINSLYGDSVVWQSLRAVKEGKVFYLEPKLFHYKPNSMFADAYQQLAEILYPDAQFSFLKK